ncbi:hypothetical protein FB567DRAFT_89177 [Paraphoma chrysanthemicola]|uniref:Uncharacterized protein n=1 Tax=Paraphoma chrysanthemicola TaxID=798071 RepID=A0A8K0R288_9PLEO|nr:hypothetical protein FB567DRAFT_89177 [Paraphoma chrysanthemicola]
MPAPWRRGGQDRVEYVVVKRGGEGEPARLNVGDPTPSVKHILRRSYARRQAPAPTPTPTDDDYDSDDDDDDYESSATSLRPTATGPPELLLTIPGKSNPTATALADEDPTETIVVSIQPPPPPPRREHDRDGRISQTTEHLLIAAGSIGATIIIVMIILALYTMRKRGLTIKDVITKGKATMRRRGAPQPPPKYGMDNKQAYDDEFYAGKDVYPPRTAALSSRSGSLSTKTPLQPLGRSDSFNLNGLERQTSVNRSFLLDDAPTRQNSHRRNQSATPSSPILPIQDMRRSASTRNTRSLDGDEEPLRYSDPPRQLSALPAPPTFRQFLSNRPSASQRPGIGGAMMSRFSWTNSNAPQTPHDPSRDTAIAGNVGRDSFMTTRSSVPRFRTIDSWVNQQSNRVEEQRLRQQFRMTQSSTSSAEGADSGEDEVPEMPTVPKSFSTSATAVGLPGKDVKHQRHDTRTTIDTAPIFKQHPGTEVRFSTRSMVPSEVLDMGRKNVAL